MLASLRTWVSEVREVNGVFHGLKFSCFVPKLCPRDIKEVIRQTKRVEMVIMNM